MFKRNFVITVLVVVGLAIAAVVSADMHSQQTSMGGMGNMMGMGGKEGGKGRQGMGCRVKEESVQQHVTASGKQERQPLPRINDIAPDFKAMSTHGEISLSQYTKAGNWVLLFSHPGSFTPVCTTEFIEFSRLAPEFAKRNVQLIGLSVDSIYSHLAWEQNIEKNFGQKIPFPVIADRNLAVAALYGLIHPGESDTATVRAVFLIDPTGKVRFLIYYPLSMGRNSQEILRAIDAAQAADTHGIATPVNWQPGEAGIVPPPTTETALRERLEMGKKGEVNQIDWYFSKKTIKNVPREGSR